MAEISGTFAETQNLVGTIGTDAHKDINETLTSMNNASDLGLGDLGQKSLDMDLNNMAFSTALKGGQVVTKGGEKASQ